MQRLKVLILSRNYPNKVMKTLGLWVKRLVYHIAEICELRVISPVPYCPPLPGFPEYTRFRQVESQHKEDDMEVYHPRFLVGLGYSLYNLEALTYYFGVRRLVDEIRHDFPFEVIHAHFIYPDGVVGTWLGRRYGVPVVVTEHAPWQGWMDRYPLVRRQAVWAARKITLHITVSNYVRTTIAYFTGEPEKIRVIPNGVDGSVFTPLKNGVKPNPNQILYVGFINFNKGLDILLQAMPQVVRHRPEAKLVLVGGSIYRNTQLQEQRLRQMAHDLGLEGHVEFIGPKLPMEVSQYMRESAVLVLPSRLEAFGSVIVEALACGTPVIATRSGGPEDIINEKVGLLVPKEDSEALASAIIQVLERRDEYDAQALRDYTLKNFSWQGIARQTVDVYKEAMNHFQVSLKNTHHLSRRYSS
ncbi:MAG TPA: glycosyltransferase [Candidatus Limnocylindrales bacterium]|nr:glycosyltransferase [Candidatus Limnocylindrales bacterium]